MPTRSAQGCPWAASAACARLRDGRGRASWSGMLANQRNVSRTTGRIDESSARSHHTHRLLRGGCLSLFVRCCIFSFPQAKQCVLKGTLPLALFRHLLHLTFPKHGMPPSCNPRISRNPHCHRTPRSSLLRCSIDQICLLPQGNGQRF